MSEVRLIDANALIKRIQEFYCANCDNYNGVRCRACGTDDAIAQLDNAQDVEAIPVTWILNMVGNEKDYALSFRHAWSTLVGLWEKEQEEKNG